MSAMRSPGKGSASCSDVSKIAEVDTMNINTSLRKRRKPESDCDCHTINNEIKLMMENFTKSQMEFMSSMKNDISQVVIKVNNIQSTTDNLAIEQKKILKEISELKEKSSSSEQKIKNLEDEIAQLRTNHPKSKGDIHIPNQEQIIQEFQDRSDREKNLIVLGIEESSIENHEDRQKHDKEKVFTVLKTIVEDTPQPLKVIRLGKYKIGSTRLIKACFSSSDIPRKILRNKNSANTKNIKVFADLTPAQQSHLKELRQQLASRQDQGETGLTIKYVNGVPKIVSLPKN